MKRFNTGPGMAVQHVPTGLEAKYSFHQTGEHNLAEALRLLAGLLVTRRLKLDGHEPGCASRIKWGLDTGVEPRGFVCQKCVQDLKKLEQFQEPEMQAHEDIEREHALKSRLNVLRERLLTFIGNVLKAAPLLEIDKLTRDIASWPDGQEKHDYVGIGVLKDQRDIWERAARSLHDVRRFVEKVLIEEGE